jgi:hypothetical protein
LGAVVAEARGQDATAGAIGGATESILGNLLDQSQDNKNNEQYSNTAKTLYTAGAMLAGGIVAEEVGHDGATAANAAQNAVQNNYLHAKEVNELVDSRRACAQGDSAACQTVTRLEALDKARDIALMSACSGGDTAQCSKLKRDANRAQASLDTGELDALLDPAVWGDLDKQGAQALMWSKTDDVLQAAAGRTSEQIQQEIDTLKAIRGAVVGMTPVVGTVDDLRNATDPVDYLLALIGVIPADKVFSAGSKILKDVVKTDKVAVDVAGDAAAVAKRTENAVGDATNATKGELNVGSTFGKLGTVVENPGISITGLTEHGIDQVVTRGVSPAALQSTINAPVAVLQQSSGRYLYVSEQAVVVVTPAGKIVTTYPSSMFDASIQNILRAAGK